MNPVTCTIGECADPATRQVEIRRKADDKLPAEVRPVCSSPLCSKIARLSAADFSVQIVGIK